MNAIPHYSRAACMYRGYLIEPTPVGRWVAYPGDPSAAGAAHDAGTINEACELIDGLIDGPDAYERRFGRARAQLHLMSSAIALVILIALAVVLCAALAGPVPA